MSNQYIIQIMRDDKAGVYIGKCNDVRGLIVEEATIEKLMQSVSDLLPQMVADNLQYDIERGITPLFQLAPFIENIAVENRAQ